MHMLYNSDNFAVMQVELPHAAGSQREEGLTRGGYEIVDKFARKEIFIEGVLAESFKLGVEALIEEGSPSEEEIDDYIERYTSLAQHPLVMH
ncbi:MAG: DUF3567 domain-containing protein [Rhizobacter sp.]|nr:DUF3567 domain-containing protein [Rhizobacter sp.]